MSSLVEPHLLCKEGAYVMIHYPMKIIDVSRQSC